MGKTTQQTSQSSSPPPQVLQNYQDLVNRAQGVANTPYQQYQGQIVAGGTHDQNVAMQNMDYLYGMTQPYINQAAQYYSQSASPINLSNSNTAQYTSPYSQAGAAAAIGAGQGIANYGTAAGQGIAGYGTAAGQNIANYGNNAGNSIANYATGIGASGPQLQQYNSQNLQPYLDPYTQSVINATGANIDRSNSIQQNDLLSAGIKAGNAFGGDRAGVAQAELARNQGLAKNQVMAQLQSQGFQNAQTQFNANNQQALAGQQTALSGLNQGATLGLGAQQAGAQLGMSGLNSGAQLGLSGLNSGAQLGLAGSQMGTQGYQNAQQLALAQQQAQNQFAANAGTNTAALGNQALSNQLTAANAQMQSGTLQQQQQQNELNAQYQQWLQQQAYPFQATQFLGNTIMGTGAASGGTSQTTSPGPNIGSQVLGLGAMGLGAFLSDERAKENIETVGKTFDGQPIHRFNYKGDPRTQLGLIAQEVEKSHPFAVHDNGGMKMVNYDVATADAAEKGHFAGGGYVAQQSGAPGMFQPIDFTQTGVRGYVPDAGQQAAGRGGVGIPAYPTPPKVDNSISPGMSAGASAIGKGLAGMNNNYGLAGDTINFGGAGSSTPIMGMESAPTINFGMARGGLVGNNDIMQGFAFGGMPDDPFGEENRAAGLDALRNGMGTPSPYSIPGGEPPPEPFRLAGPEAMDAWRKGVDRDVALGLTAPEPAGTALAQNTPMSVPRPAGLGAPPLPPQITGPQPEPETAMAYAQPPAGLAAAPTAQPPAQQMAQAGPQPAAPPNFGQALMAAGLGMMASRSPTLLGGVGEGGAAGLQNYMAQQKAYNELDAHPVIDHSGPTTRIYYPSTKQWIDTGIPTMSAAQKAANELQKSESTRTQGNADRSYKLQERAQDRLEAAAELPTGYRKNKDGVLEAIPGGPTDPAKIKADADAKRGTAGLLDDDTIKDMAGQYLEGDKSVMQNLGRGAQGAENIVKIRAEIGRQARERGMTPAGVATMQADFAGRTAAMRSLGTRGANVEYAANTANKAIDLADEAYSKLPRGQFVPLNQLREMYDKKTSSPEQAAAYAAVNTLVNEYARVASGGSNQATEGMRHHAREMLNTAMGPDAFKAVLSMMRKEIQTAKAAYNETRKEFLANGHGGEGGAATPAPGAAAPAPAASGSKPTLQEFLAKAKAANPGKSDAELTAYYNKTYGG